MRWNAPNGYLLKKKIEESDENAVFIDVQLPKVKKERLNLGLVTLEPKYPEEIKLSTEKLADLRQMRNDLANGDRWIDELIESQSRLEGDFMETDDDCE